MCVADEVEDWICGMLNGLVFVRVKHVEEFVTLVFDNIPSMVVLGAAILALVCSSRHVQNELPIIFGVELFLWPKESVAMVSDFLEVD